MLNIWNFRRQGKARGELYTPETREYEGGNEVETVVLGAQKNVVMLAVTSSLHDK